MFSAIVSLASIFNYFGTLATNVIGAEAPQPFASFKADVDLDIEDSEFELIFDFTLGPGSNGIDPATEPVVVDVKGGKSAFSITIPAGSFKKDRSGQFAYQGTMNRVRLLASLRPARNGAFHLEMEGDRVNLKGVANPVSVSLAIGDDAGTAVVKAKIE
jgi:hypothetical protein